MFRQRPPVESYVLILILILFWGKNLLYLRTQSSLLTGEGVGVEPGPLISFNTLWVAVKGYLVHGEGPRPVAGVESAAAWKGRAYSVLPTLCRTFRPIQKKNSAAEEKNSVPQ
jgi:hypothetical protein